MYVVPRVVYTPPTPRPVVIQLSGGRVVQIPQVYPKPKSASAPVVTSPPPQKNNEKDKEKKKDKPKKEKKEKKKTSRRVCSLLFM